MEFTKIGRDGTLVRIIQGPYEPDVAGWHGEGWEKELTRLAGLPRQQPPPGGHVMTDGSSGRPAARRVVRQKPLMTMRQILLMNLGFFGIQYSFGMQQTAVNPVYEFLGADPGDLPILNLAGPITGLFIQPLIGALSDRTWSPRWGRRKPFFLIGAIGCSLCLFLFPFVTAVWMAVLLLWLLDASNNTAMEPYRAFIADKLPPSQLGKGFLAQSFFTGLGITLANVSLFVFQQLHHRRRRTRASRTGCRLVHARRGLLDRLGAGLGAHHPGDPAERRRSSRRCARRRAASARRSKEIGEAIVEMPAELRKLALVYLFQWYAMVCYWQFVAAVHRPVGVPGRRRRARSGRRLMDRPGQRLVQHRHVPRRLPARRLRQEARRQGGALRLPAAAPRSGC